MHVCVQAEAGSGSTCKFNSRHYANEAEKAVLSMACGRGYTMENVNLSLFISGQLLTKHIHYNS